MGERLDDMLVLHALRACAVCGRRRASSSMTEDVDLLRPLPKTSEPPEESGVGDDA